MDLSALNREQRLAAETLEGPVLVLAGAGSGKTRALTYRIANLIDHGVPAWSILALTFTNKAAREMKQRVCQLIGEDQADQAWISTFHSTCTRILRRDIEKLGYSRSFVIYDDDDQERLMKELYQRVNVDPKVIPFRETRARISEAKNQLLSPDEWFARSPRDRRSSTIHDLMTLYEKKLKSMNALDFDDLLLRTLELLADHPPVLDAYRRKFRYVLVDEYQDTNRVQYELIRLLTAESRNLCVVGDDDQSIYGWRGADVRNILDFEKDYPDAVVIKLEQNYRSTGNILDAANQVIAHNEGRKDKKLWTEQGPGDRISLCKAMDEREEAAFVTGQIDRLRRQGVRAGQIAVLYRTNAQSRVMEDALVQRGIPYRVFGGQKFYERKEVRDILAYLRVLVNPSDDISLRRILNVPKRAIGDTTAQKLADWAALHDLPLWSALSDGTEGLGPKAAKAVASFFEMMTMLSVMKDNLPLEDFVSHLIETAGLEAQYRQENTDEARSRLENIAELRGAIHEFVLQSDDTTLEGYLENVALVTDLDRSDDAPDTVTLMTLHSAKGLEFDHVYILGLEENIFPSWRSVQEGGGRLEEERRLMYVGMTRAKKSLTLTRAAHRMLFNQPQANAPSRFLEEIPHRLLQDASPGHQPAPGVRRPMTGASSSSWQPASGVRPAAGFGVSVPGSRPSAPTSAGKLTLKGLPLDRIPGVSRGMPSAPAPAGDGSSIALFHPGERVMHRKFGPGTVAQLTGKGAEARITIRFDTAGEKTFALSIAPIVKIGE